MIYKLSKAFNDSMIPLFKDGTNARELLLSKQTCVRFVPQTMCVDDPFVSLLCGSDNAPAISWWQVAAHRASPKRHCFRMMLTDDRDEPNFHLGEVKLLAPRVYLNGRHSKRFVCVCV